MHAPCILICLSLYIVVNDRFWIILLSRTANFTLHAPDYCIKCISPILTLWYLSVHACIVQDPQWHASCHGRHCLVELSQFPPNAGLIMEYVGTLRRFRKSDSKIYISVTPQGELKALSLVSSTITIIHFTTLLKFSPVKLLYGSKHQYTWLKIASNSQ